MRINAGPVCVGLVARDTNFASGRSSCKSMSYVESEMYHYHICLIYRSNT